MRDVIEGLDIDRRHFNMENTGQTHIMTFIY